MEKNTLFLSVLVLLVGISTSLLIKTEKINANNNSIIQNEIDQLNDQEQDQSQDPQFEEQEQENNASSYQEALDKAKQENKEIVLFFTADWCGNCTTMKEATISSSKVQEALKKVIYLEIDVDNEKELVAKYKVSSIPAYFRINANEEVINQGKGYIKEVGFLNWLYKNK